MLAELKQQVLEANLSLAKEGLARFTFGNASGIDQGRDLVVIKPSGVPYDRLKAKDMVVADLHGRVVEGLLKPSSDLATHLLLYREFSTISGVAHTHSEFATAWAQAGQQIPPLGTTHADCFYGEVPITDALSDEEIQGDYVHNTGAAIVRRFRNLDPMATPAVLVAGHGPFTWGKDALDAVHNAAMLELVARMAFCTMTINADCSRIARSLQDCHYFRKHGPRATYGQ